MPGRSFRLRDRMADAVLLRLVPSRREPARDGWWRAHEQSLRASWSAVGATGEPPVEDLVAAWSHRSRHYHSERHLLAMLRELDQTEDPEVDKHRVRLACWFHDAVMVPVRTDDEARSALWARRALEEAGADEAAQAVHGMVMATRTHECTTDPDQRLLSDLDLGVLGASAEVYARYVEGVRREHAFVPAAAWRSGRLRVLASLLQGGVYCTPSFRDRFEAAARRNLRHEMQALQS